MRALDILGAEKLKLEFQIRALLIEMERERSRLSKSFAEDHASIAVLNDSTALRESWFRFEESKSRMLLVERVIAAIEAEGVTK